jgi:hypothetical protein
VSRSKAKATVVRRSRKAAAAEMAPPPSMTETDTSNS